MYFSGSSPWSNTVRTLTDSPDGEINDEGLQVTATSAAVQGSGGPYQQISGGLLHSIRGLHVYITQAVPKAIRIQFARGGAGVETNFKTIFVPAGVAGAFCSLGYHPVSAINSIAKGDRLSVRTINDSDGLANAVIIATTVDEAND